jgi:hypothetical protein
MKSPTWRLPHLQFIRHDVEARNKIGDAFDITVCNISLSFDFNEATKSFSANFQSRASVMNHIYNKVFCASSPALPGTHIYTRTFERALKYKQRGFAMLGGYIEYDPSMPDFPYMISDEEQNTCDCVQGAWRSIST